MWYWSCSLSWVFGPFGQKGLKSLACTRDARPVCIAEQILSSHLMQMSSLSISYLSPDQSPFLFKPSSSFWFPWTESDVELMLYLAICPLKIQSKEPSFMTGSISVYFHSFHSFSFHCRLMIIIRFQVEFLLGFICSMWFPLSKNFYNLIHYRLQPSKFRFVSFHTMRMQCTFLLPCETPLIISVSNSSSYYCLLFTPLLESAQKTVIFFFLFKSFRRNSKI